MQSKISGKECLSERAEPLARPGQRKKNKLQTAVSREQNDFRRLTACFTYLCHYGEESGREACHTLL